MKIDAISALKITDISQLNKLSASEKVDVIQKNPNLLSEIKTTITKADYAQMMSQRPLIRFRPLKNSFVKKGDKIILAKSLDIDVSDVDSTIRSIIETNFEIQNAQTLDYIEKLKAYVYRHGKKDEVLAFLKYELSDVKTTLQMLYKTLDYETGGLCDYFQRPCHMMSNKTLKDIYEIIDESLKNANNSNTISDEVYYQSANWALKRIYQIQNDSRVIRAAKLAYKLS